MPTIVEKCFSTTVVNHTEVIGGTEAWLEMRVRLPRKYTVVFSKVMGHLISLLSPQAPLNTTYCPQAIAPRVKTSTQGLMRRYVGLLLYGGRRERRYIYSRFRAFNYS